LITDQDNHRLHCRQYETNELAATLPSGGICD
jgi:hypothetical protein